MKLFSILTIRFSNESSFLHKFAIRTLSIPGDRPGLKLISIACLPCSAISGRKVDATSVDVEFEEDYALSRETFEVFQKNT